MGGLSSLHTITTNDILKENVKFIVPASLIFAPEAVAKKHVKSGLKSTFLLVFTGISLTPKAQNDKNQ